MEDSHYCLKCGLTLVGLENYINHRKEPCESKMYEAMSCDVAKIEEDKIGPESKTENVEADDFFSSLELQSSSKTTNATHLNVPSKSSTGIVTRSKSLLSYPDRMAEKLDSKTVKSSETKRAKKSRKRKLLNPRRRTPKTSEGKKDKKDAVQRKQHDADDGRASPGFDRAKEEDDWNLFNHLVIKKDLEERRASETPGSIRRYTPELLSISPILELSEDKEAEVDKFLEAEEYDDDDAYLTLDDVDEFNYAPPRGHTGGKWKPGSLSVRTSPMLWPSQTWDSLLEEDGKLAESPTEPCKGLGKWKSYNPPSTHTGGKWKPMESPQIRSVPPATYTGGKWHPGKRMPSEPPATHTGGKWKPQTSPNQTNKTWKTDVSDLVSSKTSMDNKTLNVIASCQSTSGKCLKTAGGLIQYYCSPCNRRLASKKMYKKHVLSELHLKRVLQENELEFDSRSIKMFRVMNNKQRGLGKREIKKPEFFKDMEMGVVKKSAKDVNVKRKRLPRKELIKCDICKVKLASHQLGKHLVSYYHSRRIRLNDPDQQKLVLDNIHAIVKQAPYQCGICKFYFNTHRLFKKHWTSDDHKWMEEKTGRKFWCVLCNFECETSRSMELHLDSNSHREVIMAVNKSIPIIIRQKQILDCKFCEKKFRYNFALIRHIRISHDVDAETLKLHPCMHCKYKSKTVKSLQRHVLKRHKGTAKVPYFCSACEMYFRTAEEASEHRKSHKHRSRKREGVRSCPYCPAVLDDLDKLKSHIAEAHPGLRPKCSKCGKTFSLPQEVAQHKKTCSFLEDDKEPEKYSCSFCAFSSELKADVLFHETLHRRAQDDLQRLLCPICGNEYRLFALKVHLRSHTGERPYECKPCSKTFVRKTRLLDHLKQQHGGVESPGTPPEAPQKKPEEKPDGPKCGDPKCRYAAKDMEYHARVHIGRNLFQCLCCSYQAKTNSLLNRHNKIHLDERSYPCPHCPFRGRLASHLKRHLRLHTGAKPYKCPHCRYQCNILENLRKHVLFTKIHPGKMLYECKMCYYGTNASKDFKQHLSEKHKDKFGTEVAITAYIAGIYNVEEDVQTAVNPVPVKPKTVPTQPKTDRSVLKNIAILTKKFEPIAPKPEKKSPGNSVQDKRKMLEMELEKLKKQAKKNPPLRSYPTPAALKERKMRMAKEAAKKEAGSHLTVAINQMEGQAEDPSPTYILYESGISFEDNEDHLAEQEFYLLENYND
ncbi:UNVERIFIED_CONTAM: hypothetical protein PYX00_005548 [Menopon gallinae]|uniref:C2H2-type domain-containing protein n=1 Tax=Menopon gallinae TaxID=328185 RepID=A0AAW2HSN0_9NEOP